MEQVTIKFSKSRLCPATIKHPLPRFEIDVYCRIEQQDHYLGKLSKLRNRKGKYEYHKFSFDGRMTNYGTSTT